MANQADKEERMREDYLWAFLETRLVVLFCKQQSCSSLVKVLRRKKSPEIGDTDGAIIFFKGSGFPTPER